jgi:hypothetical protein
MFFAHDDGGVEKLVWVLRVDEVDKGFIRLIFIGSK